MPPLQVIVIVENLLLLGLWLLFRKRRCLLGFHGHCRLSTEGVTQFRLSGLTHWRLHHHIVVI